MRDLCCRLLVALAMVWTVGCGAPRTDALLLRGDSPAAAELVTQRVADVELRLPAGFQVNLFAEGLGQARFMAFDPKGRLMVADLRGSVYTLPDEDHDGRADRTIIFASGLRGSHSLTWYQGKAYVAGTNQVTEFTDADGDGRADSQRVIISGLPSGGHFTRTIVFGPDGKLYLSVGSSMNVGAEQDPRRATILQYNADGTGLKIFATGLRNAVGLAFDPATKQLWATDNGRDNLGDNLPPDELDIVRPGGFYGWPYYYGNNVPDPGFNRRPAPGLPPALGFQAHSAPLGLAFYTGRQFPQEYWGDLFVCFHGSWNRSVPTGYKVVRVRVKDNRPVSYEDFVTGFLTDSGVKGRPAGVIVGADGALYFSDDSRGRIYRISRKYENRDSHLFLEGPLNSSKWGQLPIYLGYFERASGRKIGTVTYFNWFPLA